MNNTSQTSQSGQLDGKTVLIFGGTSGIGLEAAIEAQQAGANVIVVGRGSASAEKVAKEHKFAGWRSTDVTDANAVEQAVKDIPTVDHPALLAGTFVAGKVRDAEVGYLRRAFEEPIWAAVSVIRALGDRLSRDGSVTFISGSLADRPNAYGTAVLPAASAAMEALARGLALELAPTRFNTLSPGPIDTPLMHKAFGNARDGLVEGLKQTLPLHRLGTAAEAGASVVFLMINCFMNGVTLNLDGGARLV
jgi:NAD(P)-dependent dehydrogenase (short-subunit alcohol dehydrogenase family)